MLLKPFFAFVLCSVVICESTFVDTLTKCPKDDGVCLGKLVQFVLKNMPENGIEELGIPSIDPAKLNFDFSIPSLMDITFDGVAKGVRNTIVNKFTPNLEDYVCKLDVLCNIVIKGNYTVLSSSPVLRSLFNNKDIRGNGHGKMKLENVKLNLELPYDVKKVGDETFLIIKKDKVKYLIDIGKLTLGANNLYVGDTESSAAIVSFVNQEWKSIVASHGKIIFAKVMDFVSQYAYLFFRKVPINNFLNEDLSQYVTQTE